MVKDDIVCKQSEWLQRKEGMGERKQERWINSEGGGGGQREGAE